MQNAKWIPHRSFCCLHSTTPGDRTMTYRKLARPASLLTLLLGALMSALPAAVSAASTPALKSAVSRRLHAGVAYDIPLPQSGAGGIECRQLTNGMTVVINFDQAIIAGNAAVSAGTATVASATPSGSALVVNLTNVADAQSITLALSNVTAASGGTPAAASVFFRVLAGDVNGSGIVTASDVAILKFNSGLKVDGATFRSDLNSSGAITAADVALCKFSAGKSVAGGPSLNTPPTISAIGPQSTTTGTPTGAIGFTAADAESDPATLDVKATSDNQALLPDANIALGGAAANRTVTLTPVAGQTGTANVTITVHDGIVGVTRTFALTVTNPVVGGTGTLFVATMRPQSGAVTSGSGSAVLQLSSDGTYATLRFNYSNLTSPKVAEHIHGPGDANSNAGILFDIDTTAPAADGSYKWVFAPSGNLTVADQVNAIRSGLTYINIHSSLYPSGEIRGQFIATSGSQTFTPPPPPPTLPGGNPSQQDAVRFLRQASYGATPADIAYLTANGYDAWLNTQFNTPQTSMFQVLTNWQNQGQAIYKDQMWSSWWYLANKAPDQLRQRVTFALNELFVVSINSSDLDSKLFGMARYYDTLGGDAFGNYRQCLVDMTLNPCMGLFLNMLGNRKANPATGTNPNENYAREVMQLFGVGLNQLQPDGTLKLDQNGLPMATYDQKVVTEMARVLTGWDYHQTGTPSDYPTPNVNDPMTFIPSRHDTGSKTIINGVGIPANLDGNVELQQAIDAIFNHPNVGPFVSRQLIQKLVTSNPSPAYVYRVAQVFNNNGQGVRGDMKAVVRAVLTDYEARSSTMLSQQGFGKLNEPMLRTTQVMRAFGAHSTGAQQMWYCDITDEWLAQSAMHAPSVFNFYMPNYIQPGQLAQAGLVAPEFQITTETTTMTVANWLRNGIYGGFKYGDIKLDLSGIQGLAGNPSALVDQVALLLCAGNLNPQVRTIIINQVTAWNAGDPYGRAALAVHLVSVSPDAAVQK
jgi:uncharacterized protein (DUF1800 family)